MSSIIYGSIKHKDKSYPFFLEGRRVNIVGAAWECCRDFQNIDEEILVISMLFFHLSSNQALSSLVKNYRNIIWRYLISCLSSIMKERAISDREEGSFDGFE